MTIDVSWLFSLGQLIRYSQNYFQGRIKMRPFIKNKQYSSSAFTKSWSHFSSSLSSEFVGYSTLYIKIEPFLTKGSTFDSHLVGKVCQSQRKLGLSNLIGEVCSNADGHISWNCWVSYGLCTVTRLHEKYFWFLKKLLFDFTKWELLFSKNQDMNRLSHYFYL